mmetsp:Transcript_14356/g.21909  ORF Transcript_14356/g.21909 Transcript_14356/m.21909 type:complete len:728 (-) Transcript_14356:82-2265(-)|eukprot:CAMPEP_0178916438 /NCGR_PEP_ID=MMETSP0786-20121207/12640_1 /TAXON_ID=186022 /ORGANISM="Thalassionema frauenfeldii, Strain CCMP 1798" /LENGTH=727 /DNA_ID=CAMNT_0020589775 /DNA_START=96 /DNA_END=2279 /DNA_ORIENTATION=+
MQLKESLLTCPITGELIDDPVIDHEGNSYEKDAILEWLSENQNSPITRSPLHVDQLTPNRTLKALIDGMKKASSTWSMLNAYPECTVTAKMSDDEDDDQILIQVAVADDDSSTDHQPASIICVIDVSYSMSAAATMHSDAEGSACLSLLDVVKHATRTVIDTLSPKDRFGVIAYSNDANVILPLTYMTQQNKVDAWKRVRKLTPTGGTNLWDGLFKAMEMACMEEEDHAHIIVLTDGVPNIHPPRGELETLIRYKSKGKAANMRASISTFGFGYQLQSHLLRDIAEEGNGHYCFIPDSSFVGTVFVNATANILSTALPASTLTIESTSEIEDLSGLNSTRVSNGMCFHLPPLIYGQTLDILVKKKNKEAADFQISLSDHDGIELSTTSQLNNSMNDRNDVSVAKARTRIVEFILSAQKQLSDDGSSATCSAVEKNLKRLKEKIRDTTNASLKAMDQDLDGQIREALSCMKFNRRWGKHYLLALSRAYVLQQCTNFKDPGVQIYETKKFALIRDESEELFCQLPPPAPSRPKTKNYSPVQSMTSYYNSSQPCFSKGLVKLADGTKVDISQVRAGDLVLDDCDNPTRVVCMIKTKCENKRENLVELEGGVLVTPWHPVRLRGTEKWTFPADLAPTKERECDAVHSFVLENGAKCLQIGSYDGISLGHSVVDDPIAMHPYFGSQKVVKDLSQMPGWSEGLVTFRPNPCSRDSVTKLITSFCKEYVRKEED